MESGYTCHWCSNRFEEVFLRALMFSTSKHLLFLFPKSCMLCQQKCFFRGCNVFFQWKKNSFQLYHHIWWTINSNSLEQCQWAKKDNSNFKSKTWTWKKTIILLRKSRSQDVKSYCLLSICSHSYTCCILKLCKIMKYLSHVHTTYMCKGRDNLYTGTA